MGTMQKLTECNMKSKLYDWLTFIRDSSLCPSFMVDFIDRLRYEVFYK